MEHCVENKTYNLEKICRTCLSENEDLQPVFESALNEMLMACSSIQVIVGDGLPASICIQCVHQVSKAYSFKKQCESSDDTLRRYVQQRATINDTDAIQRNADTSVKDETKGTPKRSRGRPRGAKKIAVEPFDDPTCNYSDDEVINDYNVRSCANKRTTRKQSQVRKKPEEVDDDGKRTIETNDDSCSQCGYTLNELDRDTHASTYHSLDCHTCCVCRKQYSDVKRLKRHLRVHKLKKKHICATCGKGFYGGNDLIIHTRVHTGEKPLVCTVCAKAFSDPRGLNSHMKTHTGVKPYGCQVCGKRFAHSFVLSTHMRIHTAERPYVCSACGKTFVYAHNLAIHGRSHTGERPYVCNQCSKAFSSSSTLSAHMMTHTGEKRFVCSVCGKRVARSGDLATHMRTHTGERPYACSLCPKRYRMSCHLSAHMKTHTGEKNHQCSVCNRAFADARVLRSHMTTHTGERPHVCQVCNRPFAHYSALSSHKKTHLNKTTEIDSGTSEHTIHNYSI